MVFGPGGATPQTSTPGGGLAPKQRRAERRPLQLRSAVRKRGPGHQQQQSRELYSPTSAWQKASCGWTGAQLHASACSSGRHSSSSSTSVPRMPLTENGMFEARRFCSFQSLQLVRRCGAESRSSGCAFFFMVKNTVNSARGLSGGRAVESRAQAAVGKYLNEQYRHKSLSLDWFIRRSRFIKLSCDSSPLYFACRTSRGRQRNELKFQVFFFLSFFCIPSGAP